MNKTIVLVTSIAPKNIENQQNALSTWTENGFRVISCNTEYEINILRDDFPNVEFVEVTRNSKEVTGKACPFIFDMLKIAAKYTEEICGIVNSDIYLENFDEDIYEYIYNESENAIVYMRRNEIESLDDINYLKFNLFFGGIDFFAFHKSFVDLLNDDGLIIGEAMWDYWLPIMADKFSYQIHELVNPLIFHISHPINWSDDITKLISENICRNHYPNVSAENAIYFLKDKFFNIISDVNNPICYTNQTMKNKIVKVEFGEKVSKKCKDNILRNSSKIAISNSVQYADYYCYIPYNIIACKVMLEAVIWIMETYSEDCIKLNAYFRGNRSKALLQDNCNQYSVSDFNENIPHISIYKKGCIDKNNSICTTYLCSVYIEEREEKLISREHIKGRVYLYPGGYMTRVWLKRYSNLMTDVAILGIVDKNVAITMTEYEGYTVYLPSILEDFSTYDKVILINNKFLPEIYDELSQTVPLEKIHIWNEQDGYKWIDTISDIEDKIWD